MITVVCKNNADDVRKFKVRRDTLVTAMPHFRDKIAAGADEVEVVVEKPAAFEYFSRDELP